MTVRYGILLLVSALCGCAHETGEQPLAAIDYRPDGKLLMVETRINDGDPSWFIVDSGARHSIIDPRLQAVLGLATISTGATTGVGTGAVPIGHVGPVTMKIGGLTLAVPDPWVIDLAGVQVDPSVRGLVGAELFNMHLVRIDPARKRLEIFDGERHRHPRGAAFVPLTVEGDRLFIPVKLDVRPGLTEIVRVRIDTGSEDSVAHALAAQAQDRRSSRLGQGLGTSYEGWSGKFRSVALGPYVIRDVWGPAVEHPTIGMEILRRFRLTFDARHGRLYLEPNASLVDPVPGPPA